MKTLALNRAEGFSDQTNLFQFGLAPEDESEQVARKAYEAGYRRALVIAPKPSGAKEITRLSQKLSVGLVEKPQSPQGSVAKKITQTSLEKPLKIGSSEDRASTLANYWKKLEFKARRRKDVDFIFL